MLQNIYLDDLIFVTRKLQTFNSERMELTKSQKPVSMVLKMVLFSWRFSGVNTFSPR